MNSELVGVWEHMRDLGLAALSHANRHAAYYDPENPRWAELSILQAAHATEILIKARIAQEHPLLFFDEFPKINQEQKDITLKDLFEKGKTVQWSDLPTRLWATTGIVLSDKEKFDQFGKIRNGIQHFAPILASFDASDITLKFIFKLIDPFINECWGLCAIDFDEDDDSYEHLPGILANREIPFNVSREAAEMFEFWDVEWGEVDATYRDEMIRRVTEAMSKSK